MIFALFTLVQIISINLFFVVANFFKITDIPNDRSLHHKPVVRGGGIIFSLSIIYNNLIFGSEYLYFVLGLILITIISFIDDIISLSPHSRFPIQFISILLIYFQLLPNLEFNLLFTLTILIVGVGFLNAYNFMDGINGITGLYSLTSLITLISINFFCIRFINQNILIFVSISMVIFLFFNFRAKAICFSGDVGSISIAYILLFFVGLLILKINNPRFIFIFSLYGMDTIYTILFRLQNRQNIFKPHKLHFFQILVENFKWSHLNVSTFYSILQLIFNIWLYLTLNASFYIFIIPYLIVLYFSHAYRKKVRLQLTV